jgi:hypothetical protein
MHTTVLARRVEVIECGRDSMVDVGFTFLRAGAFISLSCFSLLPAVRGENLGFESGDFTDWTVTVPVVRAYDYNPQGQVSVQYSSPAGTAAVKTGFVSRATFGIPVSYSPVQGTYIAALGTGDVGIPNGRPDPNNQYGVTLRQTISMAAGDSLSGWSAFYNGDYLAQDSAWVRIYDANTGQEIVQLWSAISGIQDPALGLGQGSPWTPWQWMSAVDSSYLLELGVTSRGDDMFASTALFDGIQITHATGGGNSVSDAGATVGMLGTSLLGFFAVRKRNRYEVALI